MRITFNIRPELKSKKTNQVPIAMTITHEGFKIRKLLSGVTILEKDWINTTMRIKPNKKDEEYNNNAEFNSLMDEYSNRINKLWSQYRTEPKGTLTKEMILDCLENKIKPTNNNQEMYFIDCFNEFINQSKSHRAKRTITGYNTVRNIISNFQESIGINYTLSEIDMRFFDRLRNYCFDEKSYRNNMFARIITNVKTVMNWAEDRNYHSNTSYSKFKAHEEAIEVIYLTYDELMNLYNFEFAPSKKHLARARDLYCFSAFTSLRWSDVHNLKHANIQGNELNLTIVKTRGQNHKIPLNKYALAILEKYKSDFEGPLPVVSSQKINKAIKMACKEAGIDSTINITRYSGRRRIDKIIPKYEAISFHSARKTFVTNSLIMGMNQAVVKRIIGHKTDSSFNKYLHISEKTCQKEMENVWGKG